MHVIYNYRYVSDYLIFILNWKFLFCSKKCAMFWNVWMNNFLIFSCSKLLHLSYRTYRDFYVEKMLTFIFQLQICWYFLHMFQMIIWIFFEKKNVVWKNVVLCLGSSPSQTSHASSHLLGQFFFGYSRRNGKGWLGGVHCMSFSRTGPFY